MLAGIINIPSPAFLISYVYINILEKCISLPMFLALTYTPVILCSYMAILFFRDKDNKKDNAPHIKNDKKLIFHFFEEAVDSSINTALTLGAYVIIFSVIVNIIMHFSQSNTAGLLISYLFEISNGLAIIKNAGIPMNITVLLTVLLDAFGGVCIIMQTKSICSSYISIKIHISETCTVYSNTCNDLSADICIKYTIRLLIVIHYCLYPWNPNLPNCFAQFLQFLLLQYH